MEAAMKLYTGKKTNIEWVQEQMRVKTPNLSAEAGGSTERIDWMDRCGALAAIKHDAAKALASIYVWPDRDRSKDERIITDALALQMIEACAQLNQNPPRTGRDEMTLNQVAERTAAMVLFFYIHNIRDHYTTKGRLHMSGIPISEHAWAKTWKPFEDAMIEQLGRWYTLADMYIGEYRMLMRDA